MQSSKQGMWKGDHLSIESIRKGYLFREKWYIKGWRVGPRGGASRATVHLMAFPLDCSQSPTLYFPVRSSRSSAIRYRLPFSMSVKTALRAGGGLGGSEKNIFLVPLPLELHGKSRWPSLTVRGDISRRSHGKIGNCEQPTFRVMSNVWSFFQSKTVRVW